jgi:hypothetical protein
MQLKCSKTDKFLSTWEFLNTIKYVHSTVICKKNKKTGIKFFFTDSGDEICFDVEVSFFAHHLQSFNYLFSSLIVQKRAFSFLISVLAHIMSFS